ncbi:MAG TPA: DUF488 domain-containing protein [Gemmatimonadaceae bacterium]
MKSLTVWTIGHSNKSIGELVRALEANRIELVADVRRFPGSRRLPQFTKPALEHALAAHHIAYCWIEQLGGRRRPSPTSPNVAWRNEGFRGYADYLATEDFAQGLFELLMLANGLRTVVMCAEVLWWRCHRRLIADVLVSLGISVIHIRDETATDAHRLIAPARLVRGQLTYRAPRTLM